MSLLNPGLTHHQAHASTQRQAASLKTTLVWYAERVWSVLEAAGRRRAAGEIQRLADRMKREGHPAADDLLATVKEYRGR